MNELKAASKAPIDVDVESGKTYWWCACGLSRTQPFCDGSHKGTAFSPLRYRAVEAGTKRFCVCKQTRTPPFCSGKTFEGAGSRERAAEEVAGRGDAGERGDA